MKPWLPFALLAVLGFPLVWEDLKENSVSLVFLTGVYLIWGGEAFFLGESEAKLAVAAGVLALGSILLLVFPGRLGEADVVFMSGMALLLPFWPLLVAFGLACVAGLAAFVWSSRGGRNDELIQPIPFLPSLYWGGLTAMLGVILF